MILELLNKTLGTTFFSASQLFKTDLFTPEDQAVRELFERRRDAKLLEEVRAALGPTANPLLARLQKPTAVLFRQLATPLHEVLHFLERAERLSLQPLILEYSGDKFVGAGNPYKRALGKLPLYQYTGSDGRDMVRYATILNFNSFVGKRLRDVCCISGLTLIEFHHQLFKKMTQRDPSEICFDGTEWLQGNGRHAAEYYESFLTLFIRDAILFENFIPDKEQSLIDGTVTPAFKKVWSTYSRRPLIVQLLPKHEESRNYWDTYPKQTQTYVEAIENETH